MHDHHHEHEHEHEHLEAFTLYDEEGNEHNFILLAEIENEGSDYWACEEIFVENEEITDFGELYIFKKTVDKEGNVFLDTIEDKDEFNRVAKMFEEMSDFEIVDEENEDIDN
ncbi:DUF1292 domain-containing protein [Thermosipho japonicus]|nr:DUF1292 domain-containing protein [Thermosipho japonicus]